MTDPLPKWVQTRYAILWKKFGEKEFSFDQVRCSLPDSKGINMFISDLKKAGWLSVKLNGSDSRKRMYRLKDPGLAFCQIVQIK